jgi:hypothetical protein
MKKKNSREEKKATREKAKQNLSLQNCGRMRIREREKKIIPSFCND